MLGEDAAEVAGIQVQVAPKHAGGDLISVGQFEQHARLGQRESAVEQSLPQGADDARVEAAEAPYCGDAGLGRWAGVGCGHKPTLAQTVDGVKYCPFYLICVKAQGPDQSINGL